MEAQKNSDFVLYCASQFPKVEIEDITFTREAGNLFWVDVEVKNDRVYPTSSDRANELGIAVKDKLSIRTASNVTMVEIPTVFHLDSTVPLTVSGETTSQTTSQVLRAEGPVRIDILRVAAIPVILLLLMILVSIAAGLIKSGIQMVIATPHRQLLQKIIKGI